MFSSSSCSSPAYGKSTADSEHRFMPPASYVVILLITAVALPQTLPAAETNSFSPQKLPGLHTAAQISRDTNGIAHIKADDEHDVAFLQGYVHAQLPRLFQPAGKLSDHRRAAGAACAGAHHGTGDQYRY